MKSQIADNKCISCEIFRNTQTQRHKNSIFTQHRTAFCTHKQLMNSINTKTMFENLQRLSDAGYMPPITNNHYAGLVACLSSPPVLDLTKRNGDCKMKVARGSCRSKKDKVSSRLFGQPKRFIQPDDGRLYRPSKYKQKKSKQVINLEYSGQEISCEQQYQKHTQQALSFLENQQFNPEDHLKKIVAAAYNEKDYGLNSFCEYAEQNQLKLQISQKHYQQLFQSMIRQTISKFQSCLIENSPKRFKSLSEIEMKETVQLMKVFNKVCPLELKQFAKNLIKKYILGHLFQPVLSNALKFHNTLRLCLKMSQQIKRQSRNLKGDKAKQRIWDEKNVKLQIVIENQNLKWTEKLDNDLLDLYYQCGSSYLVCGYILRNNPHLGEIATHSKIKTRIMHLLRSIFSKVKFDLKNYNFPRSKQVKFDPMVANLVTKSEDYFQAQKLLIQMHKIPVLDDEKFFEVMEELKYQIIKENLALVYRKIKLKKAKEVQSRNNKFKFKRTNSSKFERQKWKNMLKQDQKCRLKTNNSLNTSKEQRKIPNDFQNRS